MRKKVLIFIVTYNAERTVRQVLNRIPADLLEQAKMDLEILIIDDCSQDRTFELGHEYKREHTSVPLTVLYNPVNLGYGGNQKVGYRYAIDNSFDIVALLHGDGQYAPEELPRLLQPLLDEECQAVFGSRFLPPGDPLGGGMPLYKFIGNKSLTYLQNKLMGTALSEYHSGYRLYATKALANIPFEYNSNGFDFDTDIIIQLHRAQAKILELPIPTFYGDEICHVNGVPYALRILLSCLEARAQDWGIFYDPKYDLLQNNEQYQGKFHFSSSHSLALAAVNGGENIAVLGCGSAELVRPFVNKGCIVSAVDLFITEEHQQLCRRSLEQDLDSFDFDDFSRLPATNSKATAKEETFQKVLALDIIEHLKSPESFLRKMRDARAFSQSTLVLTTPNIAFLPLRLMLLLGAFNYGKRGILDKTHCRLFTFASLKKLLTQQGYQIKQIRGISAPYPLALGNGFLADVLLLMNNLAVRVFPGLFSYQIYCEAVPTPTAKQLLQRAEETSNTREKELRKARKKKGKTADQGQGSSHSQAEKHLH